MDFIIKKEWHKPDDKIAATYKQVKLLSALCGEKNNDFPFNSITNAQRCLTTKAASDAIDALKRGDTVFFE